MNATLLLTEAEAAASLRLCPRTLRKARQEGQLRYVLIGRAVRYTLDDLAQFIDSQRQETRPCAPPLRQNQPKAARNGRSGTIVPFTARRRG